VTRGMRKFGRPLFLPDNSAAIHRRFCLLGSGDVTACLPKGCRVEFLGHYGAIESLSVRNGLWIGEV
jgi:hypothetical protein